VAERDLDVVVFGATGVTGRRVAAYLAERAPETGARWAPAARDAAKLERILAEDGVTAPEIVVADLGDPGSLAAMAKRTRVVLNLVGPYTLYGRPVIEACVAGGAHYADLTGEIPFVRRMLDEFHAPAESAGVKIVQVCGFEALPPDLGVLLAAEAAGERFGEPLAGADVTVSVLALPGFPRPSDVISGGTFQSLAAAGGDDDAAVILDPAALLTAEPGFVDGVRSRSPISVRPRRAGGAVIGPMSPAAFINPAIIHRTAELTGGQPFRYREGMALRGPAATLPFRYAAAAALSGTQAAIGRVARASAPVKRRMSRTLTRVLPGSGFGPAADRLEGWRWAMAVEGRTATGRTVRVDIDAEGHPGYLTTARILGEAGLALAEEGLTPARAGHLTPAAALGTVTADRFERARMRFSVAG
jgi:short subunit dehydrogenase-like uncharacterized protein